MTRHMMMLLTSGFLALASSVGPVFSDSAEDQQRADIVVDTSTGVLYSTGETEAEKQIKSLKAEMKAREVLTSVYEQEMAEAKERIRANIIDDLKSNR